MSTCWVQAEPWVQAEGFGFPLWIRYEDEHILEYLVASIYSSIYSIFMKPPYYLIIEE